MSVFSRRLALVSGLAGLALGAPSAHAQSTSVPYYWASGWSSGFGGNMSAAQSAVTNGESAGFANNSAGIGAFVQSYSFSSNSFPGNGGVGLTGLNRTLSFGSSYSYDGAVAGYNFKNSPVSVFAGFNTTKYNAGLGSNPFSPFDSTTNGTPGYSVNAGVEFKPTSNISLSVGASFSQQGTDSTVVLPGASPFGYRR